MSVWHLTLDELRRRAPLWEPAAVAVGNFDGVHVGHARILRLAVEEAAAAGETPVALTFSPHPRAVVGGGPPPALSTVEHRARLMRKLGVARVVVLRFDRDGQREREGECERADDDARVGREDVPPTARAQDAPAEATATPFR